jgi:hypothetical protein
VSTHSREVRNFGLARYAREVSPAPYATKCCWPYELTRLLNRSPRRTSPTWMRRSDGLTSLRVHPGSRLAGRRRERAEPGSVTLSPSATADCTDPMNAFNALSASVTEFRSICDCFDDLALGHGQHLRASACVRAMRTQSCANVKQQPLRGRERTPQARLPSAPSTLRVVREASMSRCRGGYEERCGLALRADDR